MTSYKQYLKADQTDWLLEKDNPSVRYFALKELLDKPEDAPDVKRAKKDILTSTLVRRLLANQEQDGYWGNPNQYRSNVMYHGTAWRFMLLADLGLDGSDERIRCTAEYLLNHAQDAQHGGFGSHYEKDGRLGNFIPCFNGIMLWSYIRFGYFDDPRVQENLEWVLEHARFDDGEVLDPPEWMIRENRMGGHGCWGRHSCIRGVGPTLQALSEIPRCKRTKKVRSVLNNGIEFVLKHHVYKKSHNLKKPMNQRMIQLGFPSFGSGDMLDFLLILTKEGIQDERMNDAIRYLIRKQDRNGRWKMQRSFNDRMVVPIEEKGKPSKWITLRAMIVLKRHFSCEYHGKGKPSL
ncbi:MAG: nitrogen fixation protein NifH [Candidatus Poribacteria bacterium]